jgi:diguanylate cyclase (GGDEF)-like protein
VRDPGLSGGPRHVWRLALLGAALSLGAPGGLWLLTATTAAPAPSPATWAYVTIGTSIAFSTFGAFAGRMMDALAAAAIRDGLTGIHNRSFFAAAIPGVRAGCFRRASPLALLMLDLDHFKRVNDRWGHATGDATLRAVASALAEHVRAADVLVRWGGEEFVIACPDTDSTLASEIAERIRAAVARLEPARLGHPGPLTVSIGVAVLAPGSEESTDALLARADAALYRAKQAGRDRVVVG